MSTIVIDYGSLSAMSSAASCLSKAADSYANSLMKKVLTRIDDISGGSSDLVSDARYYLKKKVSSLEKKREQYSTLSKQITEFSEKAKRIDGEVEKMLARNQESFLKENEHLRVSEWKAALLNFLVDLKNKFPVLEMIGNAIRNVMTELSSLWDNIKYWYHCEGGREVVSLILAIGGIIVAGVILAAAIAAVAAAATAVATFVAVCGVIGAAIGAINALTNLITSGMAWNEAHNGDPAWARIYAQRNKLSDVLREHNFKSEILNKLSYAGAFAIDGIELFCDVVGIVDLACNIAKIFKNDSFIALFKECQYQEVLDYDMFGNIIGTKWTLKANQYGIVETKVTLSSLLNGAKSLMPKFDLQSLKDLVKLNIKNHPTLGLFEKGITWNRKFSTYGVAGMKGIENLLKSLDSLNYNNYGEAGKDFLISLFGGYEVLDFGTDAAEVIQDTIQQFGRWQNILTAQ